MTLPHVPFYIVRHGESAANRGGYPAGWLDSRLTRTGRIQAQEMAGRWEDVAPRPTVMIASPLKRARDTAAVLADRLKVPVRYDRYLREQNYGIYTGRRKTGLRFEIGADWMESPPQGESFPLFSERILRRLEHWLHRHRNEIPVFVGHGGMTRVAGDVLAQDTELQDVHNCAIALFEPPASRRTGKWKVTLR